MHNSSNMREISAVLLCLQSFKPALLGKRVQILTHKVSCAAYINFEGGMHADLSNVATHIWSAALKNNLTISAKWLAGKQHTMPDYLSRLDNKYKWKIHPNLFCYLDNIWGPHTMDRFACKNSTQYARYNSLFLDPTSGVDAFSQIFGRKTIL
ncbi:enzymatic polyprotein [Plakobranchus ocellatus]|uniref:Enzymatic polyprotein n=1 Tax=Plakobranchus ocellatus TaxID=259542 RepID=A0AAV3ZPV5_9GAST|nr:enzymatic polyprotein [Plakobranchus ocellatus]